MPVTNYLCVVRVSFSRCRPEKLTRPPGGVAPRRGLTGGQAALPCALPLRSRRMGEVALGSRWAGGWQRHPRPSSQAVQPHAPSSLRVRRVLRRRRIIRELRHRRPRMWRRRCLDPHQPHGRVRGGGSVGHAEGVMVSEWPVRSDDTAVESCLRRRRERRLTGPLDWSHHGPPRRDGDGRRDF